MNIDNMPTDLAKIFIYVFTFAFTIIFVVTGAGGYPVGLVTIVGVGYTSIIPGLIILAPYKLSLSKFSNWLYIVSLSLVITMLIGAGASIFHSMLPDIFPPPLTIEWLPIYILITNVLLLILVSLYRFEYRYEAKEESHRGLLRSVLISALLVILAIIGGAYIESYESNIVTILVLFLCALTSIGVLYIKSSKTTSAMLIWGISLALLYQNSSIPTIYGGDINVELYFSKLSLNANQWLFTLPSTRTTSLRLTVLHPVQTILTEFNLHWEMKILGPLFFSLIAVSIFLIYCEYFNSKVAVIGALVYIFSHPFFSLLSLNSRTSLALLFVSVFVLSSVDNNIPKAARSIILFGTFLGVLFSHYAVAPLFAVVLGIGWLIGNIMQRFDRPVQVPVSLPSIATIGVLSEIWYSYSAEGYMMGLLVRMAERSFREFISMGGVGETGKNTVSLELPSLTYIIIRYEYMVILLIAFTGLLLVAIRYVMQKPISISNIDDLVKKLVGEDPIFHPWLIAIGIGAISLVPLTFLPNVSFGIARIYMIIMVFLAIFVVATAHRLQRTSPKFSSVITILLVVMLFVNAGVLSAMITKEVSPQPNLIRNHIIENGSEEDAIHLWRRWNPKSDQAQSKWTNQYSTESIQLYRGATSGPSVEPSKSTPFERYRPKGTLINESGMCGGYIYISSLNHRINKILVDTNPDFLYYDSHIYLADLNLTSNNKIYSSSENDVYLSKC